jgi:diguanylate cyclase (GGDEF)-like protein
MLLTIVPLAAAQIVTLFAVMRTIESDVSSRARDSLVIGANVVTEFLTGRGEQLRTTVEVLASDFGLKEATATGDAATIRSVLENHGRRVGADMAVLVDLDGSPVASTLDIAHGSDGVAQLLREAGNQSTESTTVLGESAYHVFIVPLRAPVTIGWVILGFRIDDSLATRLAQLTGLDISIVNAGNSTTNIIASTSPYFQSGTSGSEILNQHGNRDAVYMADSPRAQSLTTHAPFVSGNHEVLVVLQRSLQEAMIPYTEARRGLILFGAGLIILVAIAGGLFSTTIAQPLRTLAEAAQRMISGNYDTDVMVRSDDEFGELASSFNAMRLAIGEREHRISHQALHDTLTDLPNRTKILTNLTVAIENARANDESVAVISLKLARMGEISSTLGHSATDELITLAAKHLRVNLDSTDYLGHTGTNEFVLVLPGHDVESALAYADHIGGILGTGVTLGRVNITLQPEIGISEYPSHSGAAAELLRYASIARTDAVANREKVRVYTPGREDEFLKRLRIVNDLRSALRRNEVQVWYQPKISLPDGTVCGTEALVRWQHPELGFLCPDEFIPAAEQAGTIVHLTRHVLREAVRQTRVWQDEGYDLQVSVNLSARDLLDEYLPYHVLEILKERDLEPHRLTLEITESSIMENINQAVLVLECLREIGVHISMDDFGTGHSSLAQLRNIPLHELKIDKSFVIPLIDDAKSEAIVDSTVKLAHSMGLKVVAEGVEDAATLRKISQLGCEQAQGYFLSKPVAATEFLAWIESYKPIRIAERRSGRRAFRAKA